MMTTDRVRAMALALQGVEECDHDGHPAFSAGGNVFAVLWPEIKLVVLRLSPENQSAALSHDPESYQPDQWHEESGWTKVTLKYVDADDLKQRLEQAWRTASG